MLSRVLPIFQMVISIVPFLVYTEFYFLILTFCLPKASSTTTCYSLFGILGLMALLSIVSMIESVVTVNHISKIRHGDVGKHFTYPQITIITLHSLIFLINVVMIGVTLFIKNYSFVDGIWWGYFGAAVYEMILIILAVKITKDIREAISGGEYARLVDVSIKI